MGSRRAYSKRPCAQPRSQDPRSGQEVASLGHILEQETSDELAASLPGAWEPEILQPCLRDGSLNSIQLVLVLMVEINMTPTRL